MLSEHRVATRWLLGNERFPVPKFQLPVALVASLKEGDVVRDFDGECHRVLASNSAFLSLENKAGEVWTISNRGYARYSWANYAASLLHWLE